MTATYNPGGTTIVDKIRRRIGDTDVDPNDDTNVDGVVLQDEEIEAYYADNADINPTNKREWWTEADIIEGLLLSEGRLIGKGGVLGYTFDGTAWRDAARDRVRHLRARHVLG